MDYISCFNNLIILLGIFDVKIVEFFGTIRTFAIRGWGCLLIILLPVKLQGTQPIHSEFVIGCLQHEAFVVNTWIKHINNWIRLTESQMSQSRVGWMWMRHQWEPAEWKSFGLLYLNKINLLKNWKTSIRRAHHWEVRTNISSSSIQSRVVAQAKDDWLKINKENLVQISVHFYFPCMRIWNLFVHHMISRYFFFIIIQRHFAKTKENMYKIHHRTKCSAQNP